MRKQNMAGRIALAIATVLLCAVFVTTSVLSTTFAKYTTTGELDSETARVAKWGIKLSNSSDVKDSWSVVENGTSITAATSGSTSKKIIAPGTSGYLACFKVTGNPEVAHNVTMNFNVTIGDGYEKLIGQNDYFPILISVGRASYKNGSNEAIDRREEHYYVPKTGLGTLDKLISAVNSEPFTDLIAPNGWSESDYAEYYVRWDWFYNADDVPIYIPDNVKTALAAYQSWGDDTLLSEAMVLQLGKEEVKGDVNKLVEALDAANDASVDEKKRVTDLEKELAEYLGVGARSYSFDPVYKEYNVRWSDIHNQGAMEIYDDYHTATDYEAYFEVAKSATAIYSTRKDTTNRDLCYFTNLNSSFPITDSTYYEMTFKAANYTDTQYAGVVFAATKPQTINKKVWRTPYFFYGGFGGKEKMSDVTGKADIQIDLGTFRGPSAADQADCIIKRASYAADFSHLNNGRYYSQYKVIYNGKNITCQYLNTSKVYTTIGKTFKIDDTAPTLAVGVESRDGTKGTNQRTIILRDVVIKQRITVSAKSVLQGLVNEVQAIVDAHSTDRNFTISANATIAITQTKSELNP